MTNAETVTNWLESGAGNPTAGYQTNDLDKEYSLSSFDARHRLVLNYVLDLPFGPGRRFLGDTSGFVGALVSGWSVNGVTTFQAGLPARLHRHAEPRSASATTCARTSSPTATRPSRRVGGRPAQPVVQHRLLHRAERRVRRGRSDERPAAPLGAGRCAAHRSGSAQPTASTTGTSPSSKQTRLAGRVNLTLRAEAFNLFNRVQFGPPNTTASTAATANFGQVTTQANQPRLIQLAARLSF